MSFALPKLPWAEAALAPYISAETIQFHYGKHHAAYVNNLNQLIKGSPWESKALDDIVKGADGVIFNNAAQAWNHAFYWQSLSPNPDGASRQPTGGLMTKIEKDFGSFSKFKEQFSAAAAGHFGSGWAWLIYCPKTDVLKIHPGHDAGNPIRDGAGVPLLTCDVWEHAYYIDYRNARPKYIEAWWALANWDFASKNFSAVQSKE